MTFDVHFTAEDWARIARDWTAWWAGALERPLVMIEGRAPDAPPLATKRFTWMLPVEMPPDEVLDCYERELAATRWYGDAWPKWWPNYGAGVGAAFLGAEVHPAPETETVWFASAEPAAIAELHPTFDPQNRWRRRVYELTERAIARWGERVTVGYTDIGGNLDILASLLGTQDLLFALLDAPDEVERLVGEITALWLRYYDELDALIRQGERGTTPWAAIWAPTRSYMLQSDFAYMISPRMFERFVLPDLAACCAALDHPFYHLDGKGQLRHLEMLLSLEKLRGIQWIPGDGAPPPEKWLPELRRIREGGKLCQLYVTAEGALEIVQALGGQGFALCISEAMSEAEARDFLALLRREGNFL